ncbi:uncharacterized protein LOC110037171, partial [Phalaenopsis equestris]|uniref:uncharacterized protein LOC110037171 n=1 Tax=Phalaenopsis equestris TaxID=78828 RepID=UPI0009E51F7E
IIFIFLSFLYGSVISTLPDQLKEKLISNLENKDKFQKLYESTKAISSSNAFQIFYRCMQQNGSINSHEIGGESENSSTRNQLDALSEDLTVLLRDSAELKVDVGQIKASAFNGRGVVHSDSPIWGCPSKVKAKASAKVLLEASKIEGTKLSVQQVDMVMWSDILRAMAEVDWEASNILQVEKEVALAARTMKKKARLIATKATKQPTLKVVVPSMGLEGL